MVIQHFFSSINFIYLEQGHYYDKIKEHFKKL